MPSKSLSFQGSLFNILLWCPLIVLGRLLVLIPCSPPRISRDALGTGLFIQLHLPRLLILKSLHPAFPLPVSTVCSFEFHWFCRDVFVSYPVRDKYSGVLSEILLTVRDRWQLRLDILRFTHQRASSVQFRLQDEFPVGSTTSD